MFDMVFVMYLRRLKDTSARGSSSDRYEGPVHHQWFTLLCRARGISFLERI